MRIVSLVPSVTETLSAWNATPIACTKYCEQPDLPHVGGTKNPDVDEIISLAPDLVVVDVQENRLEDFTALKDAGLTVLALDVVSLETMQSDLDRLAKAAKLQPEPQQLPELARLSLRAFVPIWRRPWMSIGAHTFGSQLLHAIGVTNIFEHSPSEYPEVDLGAVNDLSPDLIIVPSKPYEFDDQHLEEFSEIAPSIRVDGRDLFWWGVRTPAAMQRLHDELRSTM